MLFGAVVICFLFLGFPAYIDKFIAIVCGVVIIFIAFKLSPEPLKTKKVPYVDHKSADVPDTVVSDATVPTNIINTENK